MALTKIGKEGITGVSNSADATFLTATSGEGVTLAGTLAVTGVHTVGTNAVATSEGGAVTTNIAQGLAKVWADVAAGGASLPDSFNCSSIDDDGTGEYGLNIAADMGSTSYSVHTSITYNNNGSNSLRALTAESKAAGAVEIDACYSSGDGVAVPYDIETDASVVIHGDLA